MLTIPNTQKPESWMTLKLYDNVWSQKEVNQMLKTGTLCMYGTDSLRETTAGSLHHHYIHCRYTFITQVWVWFLLRCVKVNVLYTTICRVVSFYIFKIVHIFLFFCDISLMYVKEHMECPCVGILWVKRTFKKHVPKWTVGST